MVSGGAVVATAGGAVVVVVVARVVDAATVVVVARVVDDARVCARDDPLPHAVTATERTTNRIATREPLRARTAVS
jgi:hypothetical protein